MTKRLMNMFQTLTGADIAGIEEEDIDEKLNSTTSQLENGVSGLAPVSAAHDYSYVFKMLEKQSLYDSVSSRILSLVRLDRVSALTWLLGHHDRVPIAAVAQQLRGSEPTKEQNARGNIVEDNADNSDVRKSIASVSGTG